MTLWRSRIGAGMLALSTLMACGYRFGAVARRDVRRVAVPVFGNQSLRRGFERLLTREVQRQVKETLPYLLVRRADAELVLEGQIVSIEESVLIEGRDDEVLEGSIRVTVEVSLLDASGREVPIARRSQAGPGRQGGILIRDQAEFVIARGESRDSATREALSELAERIAQVLAGPPR